MEILTVQVEKATKPFSWYKNYIGEVFNVTPCGNNEIIFDSHGYTETVKRIKFYIVLDEHNERTNKRIMLYDCKIITVSDKIKRIKKKLNKNRNIHLNI